MKNKQILSTLRWLLKRLEARIKSDPYSTHFLCHILDTKGIYDGEGFLRLSGLRDKWVARGHYIITAWHLNRDLDLMAGPYEKTRNFEKIEVIKERIKELEDEK